MTTNPWDNRGFNGDWIALKGGTVDVCEPATGAVIATVGLANPQDVAQAANAAAATAARMWRTSSLFM